MKGRRQFLNQPLLKQIEGKDQDELWTYVGNEVSSESNDYIGSLRAQSLRSFGRECSGND